MSNVKVINYDHREYVEVFRDVEIRIAPGGFVEMGRSEALTFLGQKTPMDVDGTGESMRPKKLKIYQDPEVFAAERGQPDKFQASDGKWFKTKPGLDEYMEKMQTEVSVTTAKDAENGEPRKRSTVRTVRS